MTNRLAFAIFALAVAALLLDQAVFAGTGTNSALRGLLALLRWLAFWR